MCHNTRRVKSMRRDYLNISWFANYLSVIDLWFEIFRGTCHHTNKSSAFVRKSLSHDLLVAPTGSPPFSTDKTSSNGSFPPRHHLYTIFLVIANIHLRSGSFNFSLPLPLPFRLISPSARFHQRPSTTWPIQRPFAIDLRRLFARSRLPR